MKKQAYRFEGDATRRSSIVHPEAPKHPEPYVADPGLIRAVNLAILLKRPLLLEGEAGCGKTRLARAVAYELGLPFYPWYIRSTTKAEEGLYTYDAVHRLHDVQTMHTQSRRWFGRISQSASNKQRNPHEPTEYRRFGPLGKAFREQDQPAVVLIDEIDKADIDFPNDLLAVLDEPWEFEIPETGETGKYAIKAVHEPIVIITSNKEKGNLPAPFLRRCLYYFVEFPKADRLKSIVEAHYSLREEDEIPASNLTEKAVSQFLNLRQDGLHKKPGTSEFLDWLEALHNYKSPHSEQPTLVDEQPIPFPEILFKLRTDWRQAIGR